METLSDAGHGALGLHASPSERRKHPRFDMHFPVYLRAFGDNWSTSETADVSAAGAFIITARPYLLNTPIEYVLTFPPDLTKAPTPLRVRFYASVQRCERIPGGNGTFGLAVHNTAHRYLTPQEATPFDALDQKQGPSSVGVTEAAELKTGS